MELEKIVARVQKLLSLAGNSGATEAEAATAMEKAQGLLTAYNLDMTTVTNGGDNGMGARGEERLHGGGTKWTQELWRAVADLNFCFYFNVEEYRTRPGSSKKRMRATHKLVGRTVNVVSTKIMCEYIEQTIERLVKDNQPLNKLAYEEGMSDRIIQRVNQRRREALAEEQRKQQQAYSPGTTATANAVTLFQYSKDEYAANYDFMYGDGSYARSMAAAAARNKAMEEALAAEKEWEKNHPAEAAKKRAEAEKRWSKHKTRWRQETAREQRRRSGSYQEGYDKGGSVSLDQQVGKGRSNKLLS